MDYKKYSEVNKQIKTIPVSGKDYSPVAARNDGFHCLFPNGRIVTEIIELSDVKAVVKANVFDGDTLLATGHAMEFRDDNTTRVNKWAYLENCETSAVGRALGILGLNGQGGEIATTEEVTQKMEYEYKEAVDAEKATHEAPYVFSGDPKYQRALADAQAVGVDFEKVKSTCAKMGIAMMNDGSIPYEILAKAIDKRKVAIAEQEGAK